MIHTICPWCGLVIDVDWVKGEIDRQRIFIRCSCGGRVTVRPWLAYSEKTAVSE